MGIKNEETVARGEEKERHVHTDTRGHADAGRESESYWYQQERVNRADSSQSSLFSPGSTITGGMLGQLIKDYKDQLASKKHQIQFLQNLIQNAEGEALRLEERIQEFEALQEELEKQLQQNQ
ncbi:hypothetical protein [Nostoc sp. DSM 114167]|jgi:hypothetical protein|uniref:hypothetical protein n=1 Tax=Nostoc sp. DSM 114167 TaxID=3439050 RepID=UPI0040455882